MSTYVLSALLLPLVGGFLQFGLRRTSHRVRGLTASVIAFTSFFLLWMAGGPVLQGQPVSMSWSWFAGLGINVLFHLDGLSLVFSLLISGIGFLVCVYSVGYLHEERIDVFFWFSLLLFMGSMLGVVLAGDFITLLVFWEMTSISSFLLIGIHYWDPESRRSALNALFITAAGGLCLLAGVLLIAARTGSFSILVFNAQGLGVSGLTTAALLLVLLGCFTKSAQFPFHFWLPQAMAAPTPISAYLHSATMVKAGIYLMIRMYPGFSAHPLWQPMLLWAGLVTFLVGGVMAVSQEDAKALLAYSTVSQLGMITFMLGIGPKVGLLGALFHILAHATFKGSLFMGAGAIDHTLGTRRLDRIGRLLESMPLVAVLMAVCGLSMAGIIPLSGFVSKESMFEGLLHDPASARPVLLAGAVVASVFTFLYSMRFVIELPFGTARSPEDLHPHQPGRLDYVCMVGPPAVLALGTALLGVGLASPFTDGREFINRLVGSMTQGWEGGALHPHLALWHGVGTPLYLTGLVIATGLILYGVLPWMRPFWRELSRMSGPEDLNRVFQDNLVSVCHGFMDLIIRGPLKKYLRAIIVFTLIVGALSWINGTGVEVRTHPSFWPGIPSVQWLPFLLVLATGLGILLLNRPVPAVIGLGSLGFLISTIYLVYQAPDLILTQISVETVSIVIFLWVLKDIDFETAPGARFRGGDFLLALVSALGLGVLLHYSLAWRSGLSAPAKYYIERSLPEAWGHNMVNVILVDFRALDTLGEISVLGIATVGVLALLGVTFRNHFSSRGGRS